MSPTVHFASDAHFGAGSAASQSHRVERFTRWIGTLASGSVLYLLGDVFDFWVDYPTYMPKRHLEVLYALRRAQDRGVSIHFVGGNHDVWADTFFRDALGVPTLASGAVVEHQGVRLRLHHGDGLLSGDRAYRVFRSVVRNPAFVGAAKCVHPELVHRFADWLSRRSRARDRSTREQILERITAYGTTHDHSDVDHLLIGHVHTPHQQDFDGWRFTCLGDWIVHFTAARLHDGRLELLHVRDDGECVPYREHAPDQGR